MKNLSENILNRKENKDLVQSLNKEFRQNLENGLQEFESELQKEDFSLENQEKALNDLLDYIVEYKNLITIKEEKKRIIALYTDIELKGLQSTVEKTKNYGKSYFEYIRENKDLVKKIQNIDGSLEKKKTLQERSEAIEKQRGKFIFSALDSEVVAFLQKPEQEELLQNITSGLSLYFTNWLHTLSSDQREELDNFIGLKNKSEGGFFGGSSLIKNLLNGFTNFSSFHSQIKAINTVTMAINQNAEGLLIKDEDGKTKIETLPALQSPEGIYRLMSGYTRVSGGKQIQIIEQNIEKIFSISTEGLETESEKIIESLSKNYNTTTHKLLEKTLILGTSINKVKSVGQNIFDMTYNALYTGENIFGNISFVGPEIQKVLENFKDTISSYIGNKEKYPILSFVASLFGITETYEHYYQRRKRKELAKSTKFPVMKGLGTILDDVLQKNGTSGEGFEDFLGLFGKDKEKLQEVFPNKKNLEDSIFSSIQDTKYPFLIHPEILQKNNISLEGYTTENYKNNSLSLSTLHIYKKTLTEQKIKKILYNSRGKSGVLQKQHILKLLENGKSKAEITEYIIASLSYPTQAFDIANSKYISKTHSSPLLVSEEPSKRENSESLEKDYFLTKGISITQEEAIKKYGNTAAVRTFNPGNIMDLAFGGEKLEGERFTVFQSPQEGLQALVDKIRYGQEGKSSVYQPTMTLSQYIHVYAPSSENNTESYIKNMADYLHITKETKLKDINPIHLAVAHTKFEDSQCFAMLTDLHVISKERKVLENSTYI